MFTNSQHATWHHVLDLCKVREGETAIVLAAQGVDTRYRAIALQVARERGAAAAYVEIENANRLPETALAALRATDFVVDLSHSHDPEIRCLAPHGTRTLVVLEPPEILERMLPNEADKGRVLHAQACIRASKSMRVTTTAGTDFEVRLGELSGNCQYGFSDEPGHWDQCQVPSSRPTATKAPLMAQW